MLGEKELQMKVKAWGTWELKLTKPIFNAWKHF